MINIKVLFALIIAYFLLVISIAIYLRIKKIVNNKKSKNLKNINK